MIGGVLLSHGGVDPLGRPLGTDFLSFWTAARVAIADGAVAVWDGARLQAERTRPSGRARVSPPSSTRRCSR